MTQVEFPKKLQCLFDPKRYKIIYGGRGGAKSWGVAMALLIMGAQKPLRILCAREFQNSIRESVHQLLSDQIVRMGLQHFYQVQNTQIIGKNGTTFGFLGLKHNTTNIKSWEGADICWVEEGQSVSRSSWQILIPTIRKEESEIWVTFNPELEDDETYQRFIVRPPHDSTVLKINWNDNPWFPEVLRKEKDELKERDYDEYLNVWEGHCRQALAGAVYADELRDAMQEGRIGKVPHDPTKPVSVFEDLGWGDLNSLWFAQLIGHEFRIIDFYQNRHKKTPHYCEIMQAKGYTYDRIYLPHDAAHESVSAERTTEAIVKAAFPNARVTVLENQPGALKAGIEAVRSIFPQLWFDAEKCADGLQALRHYHYEIKVEDNKTSKDPVHDDWSHAADALRYMAMSFQADKKIKPKKKKSIYSGHVAS